MPFCLMTPDMQNRRACRRPLRVRGKRGDQVEFSGMMGWACGYARRLERDRFIWPRPVDGAVAVSLAQLGYMLGGTRSKAGGQLRRAGIFPLGGIVWESQATCPNIELCLVIELQF